MNKTLLLFLSGFLLVLPIAHAQFFPMSDTPINSCQGIFADSGYDIAYGPNEDFTTVICSDDGGNTAASHIRLEFFDFALGTGDTLFLYDGDSDAAPLFDLGFLNTNTGAFSIQATAANASGCITAVFRSDAVEDESPGWFANISCTPACQTIEAVLANSNPIPIPVDTGYIDICPGTEVSFDAGANFPQNGLRYQQRLANMDVLWDFGDGQQDTTRNTRHTFSQPGGYQVELFLFDSLGCRNSSFISQRVRVAPPPDFDLLTSLDSTFCVNDTLRISSSVDPTNTTADLVVNPDTATFLPINFRPDTLFLADGTGVAYRSSITFNQFRPGSLLEDAAQILGILVSIEHSFARDISIQLSCPDGRSLTLLDNSANLGSTNLGTPFACQRVDLNTLDPTPGIPDLYTFVNSSPENGVVGVDDLVNINYPPDPINCPGGYDDSYLPPGEYQPINPLAALEGCPLNGTWSIQIQDNLGQDNGWLFGWGISLEDSLYRELETFSPTILDYGWLPHPTSITPSSDQLTATTSQAGDVSYTFRTEDSFGCRNDTTLNFAVLPPTHPSCLNCTLDFGNQADTTICPNTSTALDLSPEQSLAQCVDFQAYPMQLYQGDSGPAIQDTHRLWINSLQPNTLDDVRGQICSICLDLPATQTAGLRLDLITPDGTSLTLANGLVGNSGYSSTCFTPDAIQDIVAANGNYTGDFQPQQDWMALQGVPLNGPWLLVITNSLGNGQQATLNNWSITFNQQNSYTYSWTPTTGLSGDLSSPIVTATPTVGTTYILSATDLYGCTDRDTVQVDLLTELPAPTIRCVENGSELRFEWDPIPGITNYQYRITRDGMTTDWTTPAPTTFTLVTDLDVGDEVSIEVRGDLTDQGFDCEVPAGTLMCTSSFCSLNATVASTTNAICAGDSTGTATIQILSGQRPIQTSLNGQAATTDTVFTNLVAGDYTVEMVDALGCTFDLAFQIGAPDSIIIAPVQTFAACFGSATNEAEVNVSGGSGQGYQIQWNDPNQQIGPTATNLAEGTLRILVTDDAGCSNRDTLEITNLDLILFNFLASPPSCAGQNNGGVGVNQISGGIGSELTDYTFSWSNGSNDIVQTNVPGDTTYTVTVTDAQGCSNESSRFLPDGPAIDLTPIELTSPSCSGESNGSIRFSALPDSLYSFAWGATANNQTTNPATGLAAGIYQVTITDEVLGCITDTTFTLNDSPPLQVVLNASDNPCFGLSQGSVQAQVSGGVPDYQYNWSTGSIGTTIFALPAGDYTLSLTDANNCMVTATATVSEPEGITANIIAEPVSCFGENDGRLNINVEGGSPPFNYSLDGNTFTSSPTLIGLEAGNYTTYVRDVNDCVFRTPTEIVSPPMLTVDAGADESIIFGDSVQLAPIIQGVQGDTTFQWFPPYAGIISCTDCSGPFANPDNTVDYELVVTDENGCMASDFIRVFVEKPRLVAVPTGFTPNGDQFNSYLIVHGRPGTEILRFEVYNRWGELVFQRENFLVNDTDETQNWDGQFRDQDVEAGVYLWLLEARYEDGSTEVLRGQTTLIR